MTKPRVFRQLTNQDLDIEETESKGISFVDDCSYTLCGKSIKIIEVYIKMFLLLLMEFYGANRMWLNDDKTNILILKEAFSGKINITASNGNNITNTAEIKILKVYINSQNNMMSHIWIARSRAHLRAKEMSPVINEIKSIKDRRTIISSLYISKVKYCCPLIVGQIEEIKSYVHVTLMMLYRKILRANTYMTRCEDICKDIGLSMPREVLSQSTVTYTNKIDHTESPPQLFSMMRYRVRSRLSTRPTPEVIPQTERSKRSLIYYGANLLNKVPESMFLLELVCDVFCH